MIKFNGDLTTGNLDQWDGETDANARGAYDTGYYKVLTGGTDTIAYLDETIQRTRAVHAKFTFKALRNDTFNGARALRLFELFTGSTESFRIDLVSRSTGVAKPFTIIKTVARNSSNAFIEVNQINLGDDGTPFTADTDAEITFYARMSTDNTTHNGVVKVWVDGNLLLDISNMDWSQSVNDYVDVIGHGAVFTDVKPGTPEEYYFKNFQLSNNGLYDSDASQTYWLDGTNGTELGTGSASLPMKYAITAMSCPVIGNGDEVKLVDNGVKVPMRSNDTGPLEFPVDGTLGNRMTVNGNNVIYTGSTEHEVTGAGEHEITGIVQDPHRIYVCTQADWDASGWDAIDPRVVGDGHVGVSVLTDGTVTSLASGEAGYSGTSVFYNSGGAAVHIEVPIRRVATAVDYVIGPATNYFDYKNMSVWMGRLYSVRGPSGGTGSVFRYSDFMEAWDVCVNNSGDADIYMCEIAYCRQESSSSDCVVQFGSGNTLACLVHHAEDDGIGHNLGDGDVIGNVIHSCGYSEDGSGAGIEMTGNATGGVHFNTVVGCKSRGILLNSGTVDNPCSNNICTNIQGNCYNGSTGHAASIFDYNSAFAPSAGGQLFWIGGIVTPSNTVTSDPEFTSVASGELLADRKTDDYQLSNTSPCIDAATKYWGTGTRPSGREGEPYPDSKIDMGAYQTLFDPDHPNNL